MIEKEDKGFQSLILAALLHDIGKFWQRSLSESKIRHTELGGEFFQKYLREKLSASKIFAVEELNNIENDIRNHHDYAKFVTLADCCSAGMDRISLDEEETKDPEFERLQSLLEKIYIPKELSQKGPKEKYRFAHKLVSLSPENAFPSDKFSKRSLASEYRTLWESFIEEVKKLPTINFNTFIFSLYHLLWKYIWCVPSAVYKSEPDISLFDHLKTTAAIAMCLYDHSIDNKNESEFTLLCGDVSGIQRFIYSITSKGAAKGLKGRSFYLQLLAETTAKYILRQINYPITNMLYASGGRFYLLIANKYEKKLKGIQEKVNRGLLNKYDGELYIALGGTSFTRYDFLHNKFPEKWKLASEKANEQKRKRFSEMKYEEVFTPFGKGGLKKVCGICKREGDLKPYRKEEPDLVICENCRLAEDLGESLTREPEYVIEVYNEKESPRGQKGFRIPFLKTKYYCLKNIKELPEIKAEEIILYRLNFTDFLPDENNVNPYCYGYKFIGGNFIPRSKDGIALTFNDFAENSEGLKRLGILRMDIDNLGMILAKGFEKTSISRVTSLSRDLSLFFEGYVNQICQAKKYRENVFIIYSGGDDLFIVGSWNRIVELAEDIYLEFKKFACQNEYLTISGGISLITKKYPIHRGAQYAGEAEELAKSPRKIIREEDVVVKEKDAITFLKKPVSWDDFKICREMKDLLYFCIKEGKKDMKGDAQKLRRGVLERLRRIYLLYNRNKLDWEKRKDTPLDVVEERIRYNKWLWRMVYSLSRYTKQNDIFEEEIGKIKSALVEDEFDGMKSEREMIDLIDIPTRWVEFLTR